MFDIAPQSQSITSSSELITWCLLHSGQMTYPLHTEVAVGLSNYDSC